MPGITELSLPAMLLAGLTSSPHCALMCAPFQALQLRHSGQGGQGLLWLHAGRVAGYTGLGALAGGIGSAWLARWSPAPFELELRLAVAATVIAVGLLGLRRRQPGCATGHCGRQAGGRHLLVRGLAWALWPCGLLYGLLFLALLSGSATSGALLLAAFAIGSGLVLVFGGLMAMRFRLRWPGRRLASALLIALGLVSAATALLPDAMAPAWCQSRGSR